MEKFFQCLQKNESIDVKQLVGKALMYAAQVPQSEGGDGDSLTNGDAHVTALSIDLLRTVVPALVMGTKEKNTMVRAASEAALVTLLGLRSSQQLYQVSGEILLCEFFLSIFESVFQSLKRSAIWLKSSFFISFSCVFLEPDFLSFQSF